MDEIITQIGRAEQYKYITPDYTVLETAVIYNYFCTKMTCFFAFFRRTADDGMKCPNCNESKDVCFKR